MIRNNAPGDSGTDRPEPVDQKDEKAHKRRKYEPLCIYKLRSRKQK
jgi:hypothetical protein